MSTALSFTLSLLLLSAPAAPTLEQLQQENAQLRQQVAALQEQVRQLQTQLNQAQDQVVAAHARTEQLQRQAQDYFLTRTYDAASDRTELTSRWQELEVTTGPLRRQSVRLTATAPGQQPRGTQAKLVLDLATRMSDGSYRQVDALQWTADGQTFTSPRVSYDYESRRSGGKNPKLLYDERLSFQLDFTVLTALASAKQVEGRLGSTAFTLTPEQHNMIKVLAKELGGN